MSDPIKLARHLALVVTGSTPKRSNAVITSGMLVLAILGCQADTITHSAQGPVLPGQDLELIKALGFNSLDVGEFGNLYVVEGDIALDKDLLRSGAYAGFGTTAPSPFVDDVVEQGAHNGPARHYRFGAQLPSIIQTITVDVSGVSSALQAAAVDAVAAWNDVHDFSRVRLQLGSPGEITVEMAPLPPGSPIPGGCYGTHALADPPQAPAVGSKIRINSDHPASCWDNHDSNVHLLAHEIGHTLGLRHTVLGQGESIGNRIHIPFTPTGADAGSVMNPGWSPWIGWNGFSYYDGIAVTGLYRIAAPIVSAAVVNHWANLSWAAVPGAIGYEVLRRDMNFGNEGLCTDDSGWYYSHTDTATSIFPDVAIEVGKFPGEPTFGFIVWALHADGVSSGPVGQYYFRTWSDAVGC